MSASEKLKANPAKVWVEDGPVGHLADDPRWPQIVAVVDGLAELHDHYCGCSMPESHAGDDPGFNGFTALATLDEAL
jgi:hypothetical protein